MNEAKDFPNVGTLCPLCKRGVITYINMSGGYFLSGNLHFEFTSCSNEKCPAFVNPPKDLKIN
jgi:hypothetical protein